MQQESFGQGSGGPLPSPSYRPVANPAGHQISASSYGGPPSDPPGTGPGEGGGYGGGGGYGQGGGQGGYGQGEPPPPPPGGYDPGQAGGYGGGPAPAPPPGAGGWGGAPGYPPPAMPQWSDTGQPMQGTGRGPGSYAGWWIRVLATIIDGIIVGIVTGILEAVLGRTGGEIIGILVGLFYATLLLGGPRGQTVGLMVVGTRVVDANTGQGIGYGRALLRWFVFEILWVLLIVPGIINVLWPLWDARNQTLHDKAASSVVIKVR